MKKQLKSISESFSLYYDESATIETKFHALKNAIISLAELNGAEDLRQFSAEFIGTCGHTYDVKVIEMLMKEFRLTVAPAYRIMPE